MQPFSRRNRCGGTGEGGTVAGMGGGVGTGGGNVGTGIAVGEGGGGVSDGTESLPAFQLNV